jgi:hypothetical protein
VVRRGIGGGGRGREGKGGGGGRDMTLLSIILIFYPFFLVSFSLLLRFQKFNQNFDKIGYKYATYKKLTKIRCRQAIISFKPIIILP